MTPEMLELLKDLADMLEKHSGGLTYTTSDDGIHVTQGDDWKSRVRIGWPSNGNVSEIRRIIQANSVIPKPYPKP
jgi:hypothetical protein